MCLFFSINRMLFFCFLILQKQSPPFFTMKQIIFHKIQRGKEVCIHVYFVEGRFLRAFNVRTCFTKNSFRSVLTVRPDRHTVHSNCTHRTAIWMHCRAYNIISTVIYRNIHIMYCAGTWTLCRAYSHCAVMDTL